MATLLELARNHQDDDEASLEDDDEDPLDKYEFWRAFKEQVSILRSEMGSGTDIASGAGAASTSAAEHAEIVSLLDAIRLQGSARPESKAASPLALRESEAADSNPRFAQSSSVSSPILRNFSVLPQTKVSKFNDGVWEWGSLP